MSTFYDFRGIIQFSRSVFNSLPLTQYAMEIGIVGNIHKMAAPMVYKIVRRNEYDDPLK